MRTLRKALAGVVRELPIIYVTRKAVYSAPLMVRFAKATRTALWWGVSVAAIFALLAGRNVLVDISVILIGLAGGLATALAAWEHGWIRTMRRRLTVLPAIAVGMFLLAWFSWAKPISEPYCYAVIYRSMGPDGSPSGGKEVLGLVEEVKDESAQKVTVTSWDVTRHLIDSRAIREDFLPVVYPYFVGVGSPCRLTPTHIAYEPSEVGKEYQVTISVANGEDTEEHISFGKNGECITFGRLKDQKLYIKDHLSPFDDFGGCLMSPSQMAQNPKSGSEWKSSCSKSE